MTIMRLLWLNAGLLLPLDKGGKLRSWHLLRHLARRHDVTYVAFAEEAEASRHRAGMLDACASLVTVPRREPPRHSPAFYAGVARHLCSRLPYAVGKYRSAAYARAVASLLGAAHYDVLLCDFLVPAVNLPARLPCPSVLFTHNVEAEIWRRHADTAEHPLLRALWRQQWRRMTRFEGRTLTRFDRVLAVSDTDKATLQTMYGSSMTMPISVVRTGVDTSYFTPGPEAAIRRGRLVFVGSMDWMPNEDAVKYFCRDILPRIRAEVPDATLSIVGRSPSAAVSRLAQPGVVEVTGRVDDIREAWRTAELCVVPLRVGGGTRLKIFEAMAAGRAVVSTRVGAEGLPVDDGRHLILAHDAPSFAARVVELLRAPDRRRAIARAGRELVASRFDWAVVAADLEEALATTAAAACQRGDRRAVSGAATPRPRASDLSHRPAAPQTAAGERLQPETARGAVES
jgi:sugar transferase (PEP-CTERM/EpsH1 system associated)